MYINKYTPRYMGFMGGEKKNKTQSKTSTEGHVEFLLIPPTTHCHPEVGLALSWLPRNWWMMFWRCRMNSDHQSGKPVCMLAVLHQRIPCGYTVCRFLQYIYIYIIIYIYIYIYSGFAMFCWCVCLFACVVEVILLFALAFFLHLFSFFSSSSTSIY